MSPWSEIANGSSEIVPPSTTDLATLPVPVPRSARASRLSEDWRRASEAVDCLIFRVGQLVPVVQRVTRSGTRGGHQRLWLVDLTDLPFHILQVAE